mgnify:CR=1 FL=1
MLKFSQIVFAASRPIVSGYNKWTAYKTLRMKKGWVRSRPDYNKYLDYAATKDTIQNDDKPAKKNKYNYDNYNDRED